MSIDRCLVELKLETAAGTADAHYYRHPSPTLNPHLLIEAVSLMPHKAIAADNTDYVTITLKHTDGTTVTTLYSHDTRAAQQGALTAGTAVVVDLSSIAGTALRLGATTDKIYAEVAHSGSGKLADVSFQLLLRETLA